MVREFYIENQIGQKYSFMDINNNCFLNSPSGLGYGYSTDYVQVGNTFIKNVKKISQGTISGEAVFKKYDNYKNFVNFIESSENLKFVYKIPLQDGFSEFFKDIDISNIDKAEFEEDGFLRCPITLNCKSLWYEAKEITYNLDSATNEIRWDFVWDSAFTEYDNRNIIFENKGHTDAPFKLELNGEIMNPKILILEDEGTVKELDLTGLTIASGEKFIYNTKDTEQEICKISNGVKSNLFSFLSPNFINFFTLRKGVSKIRLTADNEITSGKLTIYVQYKAV